MKSESKVRPLSYPQQRTIGDKMRYFLKGCKRDWQLIIILIIPIAWYVIFHYAPMYGIQIAFKSFSPRKGITGSEWIGLAHFKEFFKSFYFWRIIRNTLLINVYSILFGFPVPIIFALMLNEVRHTKYKRVIQTVTYFPHFISTVIVVSMITTMFDVNTGVLNFTRLFYGQNISITNSPKYFRLLYIGSGIWQNFGFNSVIYVAAIAGIDPQLYEAAHIDGASRWKCIWKITIPMIIPTILILLILRLGSLFSQGAEKILLMYSASTYEVADVISTYVYRVGLAGSKYDFGTAVGLVNTVLNFVMLIIFNNLSRKISEVSLW